mmetsp:Transcript_2914/g.5255  ORF Transcript_2914/g.5255 Transcript_2914/m.5255 type:complete len:1187 (-) Transcript_2914:180-3740(-)
MPSSLPSSLPTSPVRLSSPPARPRDSPLSQGSSGAKRTKSGHLCSLLSLGAPTSTIQANPHEKVADVVTGKDRGALTLSLTVPESCVLDLIECIRSDSVQEIDEQNFDLSFKRTSCRVGVNFQVDDLPDVTAVNVQDREKLDREKEDFCVFKPGMMNDNELDSYLQQVYDTVPVEAGDLVGVCDHTSHSGFSNLSLDLKQGSNIGGGGASFATGDNVSGCDKDNLQVMDVAEVKSRKPEWRIWNEKFRETRLRLPLNYNQIGGCGKATSVGVVVACEFDGDDSVKPSKVWIYNGGETHFSVSTNDIRLMTFTEDRALDVLHRSGYCSSQALQAVGRSCASGSFRDTIHWAPQDINNLNEVFKGASLDIYSMYVKVRDARLHWRRSKSTTVALSANAQVDARLCDLNQGRHITMKDAILFYILFLTTTARAEDVKIDNTLSLSQDMDPSSPIVDVKKCIKGPSQEAVFSIVLARAHRVDTKAKCTSGGIPNRWPQSLPFVAHNIYFVENSNTACICLGLEINSKENGKGDSKSHDSGVTLRVLPISSSSYQYPQKMSHTSLRPLSDTNILQISDSRSIDFVLAMKDYAEKDLRNHPECMWYTFPNFLMNLISQPNDWKAWRKQVEKAAASSLSNRSRRQVYLEALLNDEYQKAENRVLHTSLPWDDSVYEVEQSPSPAPKPSPSSSEAGDKRKRSGSVDESARVKLKSSKDGDISALDGLDIEQVEDKPLSFVMMDENIVPALNRGSKKKVSKQNEKVYEKKKKMSDHEAKIPKMKKTKLRVSDSPPPPPPINMSNLWWLSKCSLPCIFYGHPGDEYKDSFVVKPICCTTFHYELKVRANELEVLTEDRLKMCTDERTREFACALLGFIEWDTRRMNANKLKRYIGSGSESSNVTSWPEITDVDLLLDQSSGKKRGSKGESGVACLTAPYPWPDFIFDLIVYRNKWVVWKKKEERAMRGNSKNGARKQAYLSALIRDHKAFEAERKAEMGDIVEDMMGGTEKVSQSTDGTEDEVKVFVSPKAKKKRTIIESSSEEEEEDEQDESEEEDEEEESQSTSDGVYGSDNSTLESEKETDVGKSIIIGRAKDAPKVKEINLNFLDSDDEEEMEEEGAEGAVDSESEISEENLAPPLMNGTTADNPICILISDDDESDDEEIGISHAGKTSNPRFKTSGKSSGSSLFYRRNLI